MATTKTIHAVVRCSRWTTPGGLRTPRPAVVAAAERADDLRPPRGEDECGVGYFESVVVLEPTPRIRKLLDIPGLTFGVTADGDPGVWGADGLASRVCTRWVGPEDTGHIEWTWTAAERDYLLALAMIRGIIGEV